ncbi:hypothetical protein J7L48_10860 [bacterium]|nr:hypothetical protein [bacterium]
MKNNELKETFNDFYTQFLYNIWENMGISPEKELGRVVLDIEPLLIYSFPTTRIHKSFFEEMVNFIARNAFYISISRLKLAMKSFLNIQPKKEKDIYERLFKATLTKLFLNNSVKWKNIKKIIKNKPKKGGKVEDFLINKQKINKPDSEFLQYNILYPHFHINEKEAQEIIPNSQNNIRFLIKSLWGTKARSEIVVYLLTHEITEINPIAESTGYSTRTIRDILYDMTKSTMVSYNYSGRRQPQFKISQNKWWYFLTGMEIPDDEYPKWLNWISFFEKMEIIRIGITGGKDVNPIIDNLNLVFNDLYFQGIFKEKLKIKHDLSIKDLNLALRMLFSRLEL